MCKDSYIMLRFLFFSILYVFYLQEILLGRVHGDDVVYYSRIKCAQF